MAEIVKSPPEEITSPEYWDKFWSAVDCPLLQDNDPQNGRYGYFLKTMDRHGGDLFGKTVLELGGCMSLRLVALIKYRNMKATVIDYAPEAVNKSRNFFDINGCAVEVVCANFFSATMEKRQFDLVTHWGVLEHQVDPAALIKRSIELCSEHGKIIFGMPQMLGPGAWLWRRNSPANWSKHIYHSDQEIVSCFNQFQWSCKPVFWGPPLIHITPCDSKGVIPWFLQKCQNLASYYLARVGAPYHYGLPFISENRGFVATKCHNPRTKTVPKLR